MRCGTKNTKTSLGATEKSRKNSRCAMDERRLSHEAAGRDPSVTMCPQDDDAGRIVNYFVSAAIQELPVSAHQRARATRHRMPDPRATPRRDREFPASCA